MLYGLISGCFSVREIESSLQVNRSRHAGLKPIKRCACLCLTGPKELPQSKALPYFSRWVILARKLVRTEQTFEFLTNDLERPAEEIAAIYKKRWEVELFFKWIKQHLKVKSFLGTSENAVYSQIWVALILTILLWIARVQEGIATSPYKLLIMMKAALRIPS